MYFYSLALLKSNAVIPLEVCPGQTLLYNCSSVVNGPAVIEVEITFPKQRPLSITYDSLFTQPVLLSEQVTTMLTRFDANILEVIINITVPSSFSIVGTSISCNAGDQFILPSRIEIQSFTVQSGKT